MALVRDKNGNPTGGKYVTPAQEKAKALWDKRQAAKMARAKAQNDKTKARKDL